MTYYASHNEKIQMNKPLPLLMKEAICENTPYSYVFLRKVIFHHSSRNARTLYTEWDNGNILHGLMYNAQNVSKIMMSQFIDTIRFASNIGIELCVTNMHNQTPIDVMEERVAWWPHDDLHKRIYAALQGKHHEHERV